MTTKIQHEQIAPTKAARPRRRWFRKALLLPAEHGSWSWLLVPFLVGAAIAPHLSIASVLTLIGGLSAFLVRQPASAWLRIRQGRGRKADESIALAWTALLLSIGAISLVALLLIGQQELLWLAPPVAAVLGVYLAVAQINRAQIRNMWMEFAGAAGLAVMAPAAYIAGGGDLNPVGWLLWLLLAVQNAVGVLYVRLRIDDTHKRGAARAPVIIGHLVGVLLAAVGIALSGANWLALLPFVAFLARAGWAAFKPRPIPNMKRFGFSEVGVELLAGVWLVATLGLP